MTAVKNLGTAPDVVRLQVTGLPRTQDECQTLERLVRQDRRFHKAFSENRSRYRSRYCERVTCKNGETAVVPQVGIAFEIKLNSRLAIDLQKVADYVDTAAGDKETGPQLED